MPNLPNTRHALGEPLVLPCGAVLKNRIAKSPMSDSLGNGAGDPTQAQARLYERWSQGGVALSVIGEVQGDHRFPENTGNLVLGPHTDRAALKTLIDRAVIEGAHLWPQIGHAGALSHLPISQPVGPSALDLDQLRCAGMSLENIQALPGMYAQTAACAKAAGFTGVQIHAGHGFLLSQFLSPLFNHRDDGYGGSIEARTRIVLEIIDGIRRAVGPSFPVGIRINATDKLEGGLTEADSLKAIGLLDQTSIDLIDISGGTYFPGAKASSDGASESGPYFLDFARQARTRTRIPLMVSGGFKRREQAVDAVAGGAADMVGLARTLVLEPRLAEVWTTQAGGDPVFPALEAPARGGVTVWYTMRISALAEDREDGFSLNPDAAMRIFEERDAQRCIKWREKFPDPPAPSQRSMP